MSYAWGQYNKLLASQPLLTKALTSLTGFTIGDILAQKFIETDENGNKKSLDVARTARMGSFGFLLHGTTGHYFYGFLDSRLPGTAVSTVATKVAIDQTIWNPIFGIMFFSYLNFTEGKSFEDLKRKISNDLSTAVMGSWAVWVPAHTVNFAFVPPSQRLLYINTIQIGYNIFLSFLGNRSVEDVAEKKDQLSESAKQTAENAKQTANQMSRDAKQTANQVSDNAKQTAEDARRRASEQTRKFANAAQDVKEDAQGAARDMKTDIKKEYRK